MMLELRLQLTGGRSDKLNRGLDTGAPRDLVQPD